VCLDLQCALIEFARNILGWKDAHSTEADANTTHPVALVSVCCIFSFIDFYWSLNLPILLLINQVTYLVICVVNLGVSVN